MDECPLRLRTRNLSVSCDENECVFWSHFGPEGSPPQCAVQYFRLLDEQGQELAEWLLSLKEDQIVEALGLSKVHPAK